MQCISDKYQFIVHRPVSIWKKKIMKKWLYWLYIYYVYFSFTTLMMWYSLNRKIPEQTKNTLSGGAKKLARKVLMQNIRHTRLPRSFDGLFLFFFFYGYSYLASNVSVCAKWRNFVEKLCWSFVRWVVCRHNVPYHMVPNCWRDFNSCQLPCVKFFLFCLQFFSKFSQCINFVHWLASCLKWPSPESQPHGSVHVSTFFSVLHLRWSSRSQFPLDHINNKKKKRVEKKV